MGWPTLMQTPGWVIRIADDPAIRLVARILLTSAYWFSGLAGLFHWKDAVSEERSFHLRPPGLLAALTILVKLVGSALVICDVFLWFGAGMLVVFTAAAMFIAYPFWKKKGAERSFMLIGFCEHLGLIAGFMLAVLVFSAPFHSAN